MDPNVRSLYIRVLRGKYDRGRNNPKYMRNVRAEIEWFYQYNQIKQLFNNDPDCPEEVFFGWSSSRMPGCYKWAMKFLPEQTEEMLADMKHWEEDAKRIEEHRKKMELIKQRAAQRKQMYASTKQWLCNFKQKIKGK